MANKARYYGIGTKQAIDARNTASPNIIIEDTLTRRMVDSAIVALSLKNPGFDKLSAQRAAEEVKDYLKDSGFEGTLDSPGGKITDGANTYSLTHANNDKGQIVVGEEKHDATEELKKKTK